MSNDTSISSIIITATECLWSWRVLYWPAY